MSPADRLVIEPLGKVHDRRAFSSGTPMLDRYLAKQAGQDMRRKANAVFVARAETDEATVLGYYTLCATGVPPEDVPEVVRARLPRYPVVSATLIGRLAVAEGAQGQGLGGVLVIDALQRAKRNTAVVGSSMIVADAIDERAAGFYGRFGFTRLPNDLRMLLPIASIPDG